MSCRTRRNPGAVHARVKLGALSRPSATRSSREFAWPTGHSSSLRRSYRLMVHESSEVSTTWPCNAPSHTVDLTRCADRRPEKYCRRELLSGFLLILGSSAILFFFSSSFSRPLELLFLDFYLLSFSVHPGSRRSLNDAELPCSGLFSPGFYALPKISVANCSY